MSQFPSSLDPQAPSSAAGAASTSPESLPAAPPPSPFIPAWLWAPCALYAVSAACILIGISKILIPLYDAVEPARQIEKFHCLVALNVYELALIAVALVVVLRSRVYDDAIALTLIIAIFLVGSSVALDTIAPDFPQAALMFGLAGLAAAAAKLFMINRHLTGRMPAVMIAGLAVMLASTFLAPALLAHLMANGRTAHELITPWRWISHLTLIGGGLLLLGAMTTPTGCAMRGVGQPFLRTAMMRWIVAGMLLLGCMAHLDALTWAFNVPVSRMELAPLAALLPLIALERLRSHGYRLALFDVILGYAPLAFAIIVITAPNTPGLHAMPLIAPTTPAVWLIVIAALLTLHVWRREQPELVHLVWPYVIAAVLLAGVEPERSWCVRQTQMNWNLAGFTAAMMFAVVAWSTGKMRWAMASAFALSLSVAACPLLDGIVRHHRLHRGDLMVMTLALSLLMLRGLYRMRFPRAAAFVSGLALSLMTLHLFFPGITASLSCKPYPPIDLPLTASVIVFIYVGLIALWTRDWWLPLSGCVPLLVAIFRSEQGQGWAWVGLSFVVLFLGAVGSLRKGRRRDRAQQELMQAIP